MCTAGGVPNPEDNTFLTEFIKNHEYTIEEKLINICDLMCPHGGRFCYISKSHSFSLFLICSVESKE